MCPINTSAILSDSINSPVTNQKIEQVSIWLGIFTSLLFCFRRAWVTEDAYITFRTIDNFINGYGLVWNVGERVQSYTHPLWLALLIPLKAITHELFLSVILFSILLTLAALVFINLHISVSIISAWIGLAILMLSNTFVDFSTSGLENPLSHFLVAAFCCVYFRTIHKERDTLLLALLASSITLTRMDLMLVILPALLAWLLIAKDRLNSLKWMALGLLPVLLWEIFSLVYYGFPFPNTAYAKLNTQIPDRELIKQGFLFLLNGLQNDPITIFGILIGMIAPFIVGQKRNLPLSFGILLYLLYTIRIGGDFMQGRFLSVPLLLAVILLSRVPFHLIKKEVGLFTFAAIFLLGFSAPIPTFMITEKNGGQNKVDFQYGIANERLFYFPSNSLIAVDRSFNAPYSDQLFQALSLRFSDKKVVVATNVGIFGYYAGSNVHIIDELALSDAFLARLPATPDEDWRIGHFYRSIPDGYESTILSNQNRIVDTNLANYYDHLSLVIHDENIFSISRLREIWRLNTGYYDWLLRPPAPTKPDTVVSIIDIEIPIEDATPWDAPGNIIIPGGGISVLLTGVENKSNLHISLDNNDAYQIYFLLNGTPIGDMLIEPEFGLPGLKNYSIRIPDNFVTSGYNKIDIYCIRGDGACSLGHIQLQ